MADLGTSGPLLASLLMGQRQEENPFQAQRKFGRNLIVQGSSTAPLGSGNALEGLARALQGGLGGLVAGYADQQEQDQTQHNIGVYADAAKVAQTDPAKATELLKGLKGGGYQQEALLGQILQSGITTGLANQAAETGIKAGGYGTPQPGQGNGGTAITITPGQRAPDNNWMNIRATNIPWEGKTTPPGSQFETFANPQYGANATAKNFASYVRENPNITVGEAIAKWAPAGDGNNDPQAYAARIAQAGIPPTARMADVLANPDAFAKLAMAGTGVEKGGIPAGATPQIFAGAAQSIQQPQGQPQVPPGSQPPMQIPVAQGSQEGNVLRAKADALRASGQAALALPLYKEADIADGKNADIRANRDVPGTPAGDVAILQAAIRNPQIAGTPEYAAAHARVGKPQMAQGGQLYFPDMTAYPAPQGGQPSQGGRFQDTPESKFKMGQDFSKQYGEDPAVKTWRTIEPVIASMREASTHGTPASDRNLAYGLATLYNPTGGGGGREATLRGMLEGGSVPEEIGNAIRRAIAGQGIGPEERARIMAEAETRANAHKQQFDAVTQQYQQRGARYDLKPEDFMTGPASSQQPQESVPKVRNYNPATGRLE
jgi:hypothetical protein